VSAFVRKRSGVMVAEGGVVARRSW